MAAGVMENHWKKTKQYGLKMESSDVKYKRFVVNDWGHEKTVSWSSFSPLQISLSAVLYLIYEHALMSL